MADKLSSSDSAKIAELASTVQKLDDLFKDLHSELKKISSAILTQKTGISVSHDFEDIKRRFGPDRKFEADGFFINTSLIDVGLHITWENKNRYIFRKRKYLSHIASKGAIAGNIKGFRSKKMFDKYNKGKLFVDTDNQNGEIIDFKIPFGETVYYKFICHKIKEFDVTSDSENSKQRKFYTSNLEWDYVLETISKEKGIEGEVIETVEDSEIIELIFDIRMPERKEKIAVSPEEARLLEHEKTIMEADGVLDVFEEIERRRRERIAKIEAMDITHEEKENMKKLANRVYADVASSRVKW